MPTPSDKARPIWLSISEEVRDQVGATLPADNTPANNNDPVGLAFYSKRIGGTVGVLPRRETGKYTVRAAAMVKGHEIDSIREVDPSEVSAAVLETVEELEKLIHGKQIEL